MSLKVPSNPNRSVILCWKQLGMVVALRGGMAEGLWGPGRLVTATGGFGHGGSRVFEGKPEQGGGRGSLGGTRGVAWGKALW